MYQCSGTTQKGERCKRTVKVDHGFCSYHISQASTLSKHDNHKIQQALEPSGRKTVKETRPPKRAGESNFTRDLFTIPGQFETPRSNRHKHIKTRTPTAPKGHTPQPNRPQTINYDTFADSKTYFDKAVGEGYIYIYTMQNFLDPPKGWTFKVKNIPNTSPRKKDKWIKFKSRRSPYILVKIGMTTQSPNVRIKQWENKCKHKLVNLGPQNKHLVEPHLHWWQKFLCVSKYDDDDDKWMKLTQFKKDGFYCKENVGVVETTIHQLLRKKYGRGDVYCSGCIADEALIKNKEKDKVPLQNNYNVHVEWFLIPKEDLQYVYMKIDHICRDAFSGRVMKNLNF